VIGGGRAEGFPTPLYWQATVLDGVTDEMEVAREETFGPVVPITTIRSDAEALQIANSSPYGLLAAVWTRDLARGLRFAEAVDAGWVNLNESTNYWESHLPFGGRAGSRSGVGRVGGGSAMETFTEPKTVVFPLA
jgi:acyl-CoA reductase-like NAD-dependent aldehyde dehydrogenase